MTSTSVFKESTGKTVYAIWTPNIYTITLKEKNEIIYEKYNNAWCSDKNCNTKITSVTIPTKTGYIFKGYYSQMGGKGIQVVDEKGKIISGKANTFANNNVLYPYYVPEKFTLTYDVNEGNDWNSTTCPKEFTFNSSKKTCTKSVEYDGKYGDFPTPTKTGYTLSGWFVYTHNSKTDKNEETVVNKYTKFDTIYSKTAYAKWTPNIYEIKLSEDKTTSIYEKYENGWYSDKSGKTQIKKITIPYKTGYAFMGYYTRENGKGTQIIDSSGNFIKGSDKLFLNDSTLYPYFTTLECTLTFLIDAGDEWNSTTCPNGFIFNKNTQTCKKTIKYGSNYGYTPVPTRKGYTFDGWYVKLYNAVTGKYEKETSITASSTFKIEYDQALYPKWTPAIYKVILDYDKSVIFEQYNTSWCKDNECKTKITKISIPKKNGYKFIGYYTKPNGNGNMIIDSSGNIINGKTNIFYTDNNKLYSYFKILSVNEDSDISEEETTDVLQRYLYIDDEIDRIIVEKDEDGVSTNYLVINSSTNESKTISSSTNKTSNNSNIKCEFDSKNNNLYSGGKIKIIKNNKEVKEYVSVLIGDTNGDGIVNSADYIKIKKHIMQIELISKKANYIAADISNDSTITSTDYIKIKKYIMNGGK